MVRKWNKMNREQRLLTLEYAIEIARVERTIDDDMGKTLKRELKRVEDLYNYNGCYPVIFHDNYGITADIVFTAKGDTVVAFNNAKNQGEIGSAIQLLYQAKFNFDEKNFNDARFMFTLAALQENGAKDLARGCILYMKKNKTPKVIKDIF